MCLALAAPDTRRYKLNWFVIIITNTVAGISDFISTSSLHQFVTSSAEPTDNSVSDASTARAFPRLARSFRAQVAPGLGLSENWYAGIVSILSVGQVIGALLVGVLSRYLYIKHLILGSLACIAAGGIFYGIGSYGWMLLIGQWFA